MTTIRATCPRCGEVDMTPEEILLSIREPASSYRFVCPECERPVEKAADRKIVALLLSAGATLRDEPAPERSLRPLHHGLPPLSRGDVAAFRALLDDDAFVERLLTGH